MSTSNVIDADITNAVASSAETTTSTLAPETIDLTGLDTPMTRVATIDLSAFGPALELATSGEDGERFRLSLGARSVHVIDAWHPLASMLVALEVSAVANIDETSQFEAWLQDLTGAVFAVVAQTPVNEPLTIDAVLSLARLTVHPRCDRGLREHARLLGRNPEDIINHFRERSGLANLDGLVDVTTFAVAPAASNSARQYSEELGVLIDAVATVLLVMAGRAEANVVTTSLARNEQRWLFEAGWPLADCLDTELAEVLLGTRSRAGRSIPAWFRLHGLWGAVASQRTVSLGNVAAHLHGNRIELGSCIPRTRNPR